MSKEFKKYTTNIDIMNEKKSILKIWVCLLFVFIITTFDSQENTNIKETESQQDLLVQASKWGNSEKNQYHFEENKGQVKELQTGKTASFVSFSLKQGNTTIFLLKNGGIAWQINKIESTDNSNSEKSVVSENETIDANSNFDNYKIETYRMDMNFINANTSCIIETKGKSDDYVNYNNHTISNVYQYQQITYKDIYPGIDWVIRSQKEGIKQEFIVHPGSDPSLIQMHYSYQEKLFLDQAGNLIQSNRLGQFREDKPISFQGKKVIETQFTLQKNIVQFSVSNYNKNEILIIDPLTRLWGTYFGGTSLDQGYETCADITDGSVYVVGVTQSTTAISTAGSYQTSFAGSYDGFLVKFNSSGVRIWSTYFGGTLDDLFINDGLGIRKRAGIAVDGNHNVYVTGATRSTSGIATTGTYQTSWGGNSNTDAFLMKFDTNGNKLWGTYYGGSGSDESFDCAVAPSNNQVYIVGHTMSGNNIASVGAHQTTYGGGSDDSFIAKFDVNGSRLWGTYYGGTQVEWGPSCAVANDGSAYLVGYTYSSDGIASGGSYQSSFGGGIDAFIAKFNSSGIRLGYTISGGFYIIF